MSEIDPASGSESRHSGFLFNVNIVFVSTLIVQVLSFFIVVVIARLLGAEGRGVTALYQTGVNLTYAFVSFGIAIGALYYVSRSQVTAREAMEAGLTITLVSALLAAVAAAGLGMFVGEDLDHAGVPYWLLAGALPLVVQFRLTEVLLRAEGRFLVVSLMEAGVPLTVLAAMLAIEATAGLTIEWAIIVWSLAPLPAVFLGYIALGPGAWPRRLGSRDVLRRLLSFGMQGQLGNIIQTLNYRLDSYLILLFASSAGVGLYSVGVALSEGLWLLANSVAVVLIPKLAEAGPEYAARTTPLICRNTLLVTALGAVALGVASPVAVPLLFGDEFEDAVGPLLWLLPGVVALAGTKVLAAYVFSQGKPIINAKVALVTLVLTIVLDVLLIPPFGVSGAAIASSIAYVASFVLTLIEYKRLSSGPPLDAVLPRFADITLFLDGARAALIRLRGSAS